VTVRKLVDVRCDRCGVTTQLETLPLSGWAEIKARYGSINIGDVGAGVTKWADICPDCALSLKIWWEEDWRPKDASVAKSKA